MLLDIMQLLYALFEKLINALMLIYLSPYVDNIVSLSYRVQTNLLHLLIFILSGKNGRSLCKSCKCLGYSTSTSN